MSGKSTIETASKEGQMVYLKDLFQTLNSLFGEEWVFVAGVNDSTVVIHGSQAKWKSLGLLKAAEQFFPLTINDVKDKGDIGPKGGV